MAASSLDRQQRLLEAARGYLELNMPDYAINELRQIRSLDSCAFDWHSLMGHAQRLKSEYHTALVSFQKALDRRPQATDVLMGMAWCHKRLDDIDEAILLSEQAQQRQPANAIIQYNLACYLCLAGDRSRALSWLGRALRLDASLVELTADEADFDNLRNDPGFQMIVSVVSGKDNDAD